MQAQLRQQPHTIWYELPGITPYHDDSRRTRPPTLPIAPKVHNTSLKTCANCIYAIGCLKITKGCTIS